MYHLVWLWKSRCYSGLEWAWRSYIFNWLPGGTDTADLRASKGLCISPTSHNLETSHYDMVSLSVYGCVPGTAQHWGQVLPLSPTSCVTLNKGFDFTKPSFSYIWNRKNNTYLRERMWGFNEIINIKQYAPHCRWVAVKIVIVITECGLHSSSFCSIQHFPANIPVFSMLNIRGHLFS